MRIQLCEHFTYKKLLRFVFPSVAMMVFGSIYGIVDGLFDYYLKNPQKLNNEYKTVLENEGIERAVTDYIAGMTDDFAVYKYKEIYIPKSWGF